MFFLTPNFCIKIAETAFQKSKNLQSLNVLYLVTGNMENLSKMIPIYISLNDYSSAYVNALIVGDTALQIDILSKTKKRKCAYCEVANDSTETLNYLQNQHFSPILQLSLAIKMKLL